MIFILMSLPADRTPVRYSEIRTRVRELHLMKRSKISDTTLSSRLNELIQENIITRKQFNEIPLRVEYTLTEKGNELQKSLRPLIEWAINDCHRSSPSST
jgi:DNA-binding HxlR family transcriptional regulator